MYLRSFAIPSSGDQNSNFPRRNEVHRRCQRIPIGLVLPVIVSAFIGVLAFGAANRETAASNNGQARLTWSDEFNGPGNTAPQSGKWSVQVSADRVNNELQYYTHRPQGLHVANGDLVINAAGEKYSVSAQHVLPDQKSFSDVFHVMAVEWNPRLIQSYVDGNLHATRNPANSIAGARWIFDHPSFVIINLAAGGNLWVLPKPQLISRSSMLVDSVGVHERK